MLNKRRGDPPPFSMTTEQLYKELHHNVEGFVRKRVNDQDTVKDLVQDIFLKAHSKVHQLEDDEKMGPWLFGIARNTIVDHYRKSKSSLELDLEMPDDIESTDGHLLQCVHALIGSLPETYREPLLLSDLEGLGQKDIAERLELSYSGARSRVQRARKMVRDRFKSCCQHMANGHEYKACTHEASSCPACSGI